MVIKLYVSRACGNMKMRTEQEHIKRILEAKSVSFEEVDVGDPNHKEDKRFMQETLKLTDEEIKALPPQIFNEKAYRGDYEKFFVAVECEEVFHYLDLEAPEHEIEYLRKQEPEEIKVSSEVSSALPTKEEEEEEEKKEEESEEEESSGEESEDEKEQSKASAKKGEVGKGTAAKLGEGEAAKKEEKKTEKKVKKKESESESEFESESQSESESKSESASESESESESSDEE